MSHSNERRIMGCDVDDVYVFEERDGEFNRTHIEIHLRDGEVISLSKEE